MILVQCVTSSIDHQKHMKISETHTVPCKELEDYFPFVHRVTENGLTKEILKIGNKTLGEFVNNN